MTRTSALGVLLLSSLSFSVIACGSPPPPAQPTSVPIAKAPAPATPPPDLGATPEPEGLVAFARLAKPSEALKVVGGWVHTPMPGAEQLGALVTGEPIGNAIDLDAPIDYAIAMHGMKKRGAISVALRSLDDAKQAFAKYRLVPAENGALKIEGLGAADDPEKDDDDAQARVCEIAPAFGAAATRLVCGDSDEALHDLGPWLTRTATRATYPADLHLEARMAPMRPMVDQTRRLLPLFAGSALGVRRGQNPAIDDALRATVDDLADFVGDADTIAIDAMLADPQGQVTLTTAFRGTTSTLARFAVSHPERADVPPPAFWKLPGDTDAAYFHRQIDAADFDRVRDRLAALFGAWLEKEGLADADRKALRDVASHTADLLAAAGVYGKGVDVAEALKAQQAIGNAKDDAAREEAERVAGEKMAGWMAMEVDAPPAKVAATVKEWATAWGRAGVAKWAKQQSTDAPAPTIKSAPMPKGLPAKDAAHLAIAAYRPHHVEKGKKKPAAGKPMVLHVLTVPDGNATWLVFAADEGLAAAKAKDLTATGAPSALAARGALAAMKDAKMNAGGFVSARAFASGLPFTWALGAYWSSVMDDDLAQLASAPEQGMTPIPFQLVAQPGAGAAPAGTFTATITVPKAAIESIVHLAVR